jgi:tetratricopeptide (TPR) repeat protein
MAKLMSAFSILVIALSASITGAPALLAADTSQASATSELATPKQRLDALFSELKRERDPEKAREISDRIRGEWRDSGSASINLLMQWAVKALEADRKASALDIFDQVIYLSPQYVEGWNQRATLHYRMGNYRKSMSDINQVLAIEPRHFGALAGMAAILTAAGKDELALRAWEQFLEIYPADRQAQEQLGDLEEKLAGNRT